MKITVDVNMFRDAFARMDRYNTFSYEGYEVLFDFLEEIDECSDVEMELDVIAICCDWAEDTIENVLEEYNLDCIEDLENETTVLLVSGGRELDDTIIYQSF